MRQKKKRNAFDPGVFCRRLYSRSKRDDDAIKPDDDDEKEEKRAFACACVCVCVPPKKKKSL